MLATVSQTRSLRGSFYYARALNKREKDGQIVRSNGLPIHLPAATQLALMESQCNEKYKVKAINIVLSHSKEDKELLKAHPELQTKYLNDFLDELRNEGVDIDNTMWAMMRHVNTDCLHYHMMLLTTKKNGTRLNTNFLGAKAARAAYRASKKNNLHYAVGLEAREVGNIKHQAEKYSQGGITQSIGLSEKDLQRLDNAAFDKKLMKDNIRESRRAKSIREASERREKIRMAIEKAAKSSSTFKTLFNLLLKDNIKMARNDDNELVASVTVKDKDVSYKVERLGVDMSLINKISLREKEEADRQRELAEKKTQEERAEKEKSEHEKAENEKAKVKRTRTRGLGL